MKSLYLMDWINEIGKIKFKESNLIKKEEMKTYLMKISVFKYSFTEGTKVQKRYSPSEQLKNGMNLIQKGIINIYVIQRECFTLTSSNQAGLINTAILKN